MSLARCHKVSRSQNSKATGHSESLGTSTPPWRHHEARWAHQGHWGHALPLGSTSRQLWRLGQLGTLELLRSADPHGGAEAEGD